MVFIKSISITLVLVFLARIAGRRYDGYLIAIYGFSQSAIYFIAWCITAWASTVAWFETTIIYKLVESIINFLS